MIRVILNGCNGKMGQIISKLCKDNSEIQIVAGIDKSANKIENGYNVYDKINDAKISADMVVDYSHPSALKEVLSFCAKNKISAVIATTGLSKYDRLAIYEASQNIAIFNSANMSVGMNVLIDIAIAAALKLHDSFDIEILEKHHNEKKDSPSGTALLIADEINSSLKQSLNTICNRTQSNQKRNKNELGISSIRGGTIPGEHTVIFAGYDEIIEIKHTALSRDIFGVGTLSAIKYIIGKKAGLFNMRDLLKERNQ